MNAFGAFDTGTDGMVSVSKLKENLTTMGEIMTESAQAGLVACTPKSP